MAPGRLLIQRCLGEAPQSVDGAAVSGDRVRRKERTGRLVHERHELVGKARHRAADADPTHVGASADAVHPAALAHIALHHRTPAPEFDDALARAILLGEFGLLVITAAVAAFVNRFAKEPGGTER